MNDLDLASWPIGERRRIVRNKRRNDEGEHVGTIWTILPAEQPQRAPQNSQTKAPTRPNPGP